jgi:hypothetical protein
MPNRRDQGGAIALHRGPELSEDHPIPVDEGGAITTRKTLGGPQGDQRVPVAPIIWVS